MYSTPRHIYSLVNSGACAPCKSDARSPQIVAGVVGPVAIPLRLPVRVVHPLVVVVILVDSHNTFVNLPDHTLPFFESVDITFDHDEFIFHVSALQLRIHLLVTQISIGQSPLNAVLRPVLLEIDEAVLQDVKVLHLSLVIAAIPLLLLDELGALQEVVLHPVLRAVEDKRIDHHHKEKFQVGMAFKYTENIHGKSD